MKKATHDIILNMEKLEGVEYLTVAEVAQARGAAQGAVYQALHRGTLKGTRVLGRWLITPADADAWEPGAWGGAERFKKGEGK
jgi:excisionase family DNA binding protein